MIKLHKLVVNNVASFVGRHELVFPEKGLFSLSGQYEHEPGRSNGAGKSTVLRSISWALDFCDLGADSVQSWNTDNPFHVELQLSKDGVPIDIYRSRTAYSVTSAGVTYRSQEAKDFLRKTILGPDLLSFITYRPQDSLGNFLPLRPSDKMDFLVQLLNLEKYQDFAELCEKKLDFIETQIEKFEKELEHKRLERFGENDKADFLKVEKSTMCDAIDLAKQHLKSLVGPKESDYYKEEELEAFKKQKANIVNTIYTQDTSEIKAVDSKIEQWARQLSLSVPTIKNIESVYQETKQNCAGYFSEQKQLNKQKTWLESKIEKIKTTMVKCPECSAEFSPGHQTKEISSAEAEIKSINSQLLAISQLLEQFQPILKAEPYLSGIVNTLQLRAKKVSQLELKQMAFEMEKKKNLENLELKISLFRKNGLDLFEQAKKHFFLQQKDIAADIDRKQEKVDSLEARIQNHLNRAKIIDTAMDEIRSKIKILRSHRDFYREASNAIGKENFIRLITEESLLLITNRVNDLLSKIPNTNKITIHLASDFETKKGSIKKIINLQVFSNGVERKYTEFSGGEKCSINLAIDTAIADVIAERSGRKFGWLFLDESTNGQDAVTRQESLFLLKSMAQSKLILVVEHTPVVDQLDGQILVIKNHKGSYFGQISRN